jgi:predicted dehydrogenase
VGLVGASLNGGWALRSHVPAIAALSQFELSAISTTSLESAERTARQLGVPAFYDSAEDLVRDPTVDLVSVVVKVPDHEPILELATAAGKDVYCEWPLGTDTEQAERIRDRASAAQARTLIGLQARATSVLRYVRDLVGDGFLGRILSVHLSSTGYANGGPWLGLDREWTADDANGLSALTVRAAHSLDAAQFCVGTITDFSARVSVATPRVTTEAGNTILRTSPEQVLIHGVLEGGASLSGRFLLGVCSDRSPLLTVHGTEGTITVVGETDESQIQIGPLKALGRRRNTDFELLSVPDAYVRAPRGTPPGAPTGVAENYLSLLKGSSPPPPDFGHAVDLHRFLDEIRAT